MSNVCVHNIQIQKLRTQVVQTVMGTGEQRALDCLAEGGECADGLAASGQRLLGPKALASGPDGSVYVADYNLVRKIAPDGVATTVLKLKCVHTTAAGNEIIPSFGVVPAVPAISNEALFFGKVLLWCTLVYFF